MSEKQTKNTKEILSNVWNWEHTEDWWRRAIPNPHPILTTQQMLQEIQDKIANKTLSEWCRYISKLNWKVYTYKWEWEDNYPYWAGLARDWDETILWHPISLSRVLSELWEWFWCIDGFIWNMKKPINLCKRKLITDTLSDAMLDDQSEHTIEVLHKLLIRK